MQSTTTLYKTLAASPQSYQEHKVNIAGTDYGQDRILSLRTSGSLFQGSAPGAGGTVSREIDLVIRDAGAIPRMAVMKPYTRLTDGTQTSEWIQKGVFYIDTRDADPESGVITLHGYDDMLKAEQSYTTAGNQGTWPKTDLTVVNAICARMGVALDARTCAILTAGYDVPYPGITLEDGTPQYNADGALSMREVLGYIGAMYGGNWIMTDVGALRLLLLGDIPSETRHLVTETGDALVMGTVRLLV